MIVACTLWLASGVKAQVKFEREYRLALSAVPAPAKAMVEDMGLSRKVRWYKEESQRGHSIEAKAKAYGKQYSVEFDTLGLIEDVEVSMDWEAVPQKARKAITLYLSGTYEKHRIEKVQIQFTGPKHALVHQVTTQSRHAETTVKYEVVLKAKADKTHAMYEYLFSEDGKVLGRAKVVFRNTDNLEY